MVLYYSKILSELLGGISSKHCGDFYSLNYPHSIGTKNKLKSNQNCLKIKVFVVL